jgi:uncharacterized protein with ParB-like and HNH nuclease domain
MQANLRSLLDVLGKPDTQYVIPVFQRTYSWTRQQCEQLWTDMFEASDAKSMHFMGTLIDMPEESTARIERSSIIDGQQRLTTLTLMLIALRDALRSEGSEQSLAKAKEINCTYLETSEHQCKLVLSEQDLHILEHLVLGTESDPDVDRSNFLVENLSLYRNKIASMKESMLDVLPALEALVVIAIDLESNDSPQQVFESLNAKGKPLSTTDLIRNTLLVKFGTNGQEKLFETYWTPLDEAFAQFGKEQDIYLDAALHQWITEHGGVAQVPKRTDLYQVFKRYIEGKRDADLEGMIKSISESCLAFASDPKSEDSKRHLDWAIDKPTGLISQRKMFGD